MKNGRKLKNVPMITNIDGYVESWKKWWSSLQPAWRKDNFSRNVPSDGEKWLELCKGGNNGFVLIILTLAWWRRNAGASDECTAQMKDVAWVCQEMVRSLEGVESRAVKRCVMYKTET